MMTNLFSIFDTSTSLMFNFNWISSLMIILFLPISFWLFSSKLMFMFNEITKFIYKEMNSILLNKFNLMNSIFFISLFMMILLNNLMSLYPYIFTSTSHMVFSLSFSLSMWFSLIIFSLKNNLIFFLSHMIPEGTPNILMPFMILIETISNIIRPSTLSIRLSANMIAGHLILTLMSESMINSNFININIIMTFQYFLAILEVGVSMIQSYVFTILSILYLKETN